jgi:hypothetical protein
MMPNFFIEDNFPDFDHAVHAKWAPVLIEPIAGSYDRLVIGCLVVSSDSYHLEMANALSKLNCFYGVNADKVLFAVDLARRILEDGLSKNGAQVLHKPQILSGVYFGEVREAEGASLEEIAQDWMKVLSSLYEHESIDYTATASNSVIDFVSSTRKKKHQDHLPQLVLEDLTRRDVRFVQYFSNRILSGTSHRRSAAHKVEIDFKGRRLVANFASLKTVRISNAVSHIKERLWDLKFDREQDIEKGFYREHELIVQVPKLGAPEFTKNQYRRLQSEYEGLMNQADKLELVLREFNTLDQISDHIASKEAA